MTRPVLPRLLIVQTVVLILVAWAGVYFARDEFLQMTAPGDDDEGAAAPLPASAGGTPLVRLGAAAQRNVGLELALPVPATLPAPAPELAAFVLDAQALVELHGRLQAARHEAEAARAVASASAAERRRVQGLYDDDRNASQRALEAAQAQAAADAARERAAQAQWAALREGARAAWGATVAGWLEAPQGGALPRLVAGREALLRVALRGDGPAPSGPLWVTLPGAAAPVRAQALGSVALADAPGGSRTLLYHVTAPGLAPGQRLLARVGGGASEPGALLPASALVWHAGQPWVYVRESEAEAESAGQGDAEERAAASGAVRSAASGAVAAKDPAGTGSGTATAAARAQRAAKSDDEDDDRPVRGAAGAAAAPPSSGAAASGPDARRTASAASSPAAAAADAEPAAFQRRAVPGARRVGEQWFVPGFEEDDPVVVRGAQVLLSEELKYQIRNENDD